MKQELIGRIEEQELLEKALHSNAAELVSIIGRRRVGKTFLVQTVYKDYIAFEMTGIQYAPRKEQLQNFAIQLSKYSKSPLPISPPDSWLSAFYLLSEFLETKQTKQKTVVFLDELPWMATRKSGFLRGLSWFWNSWAIHKNIIVVICGSAASWMIQKVVRDKGGLHNRITRRISLEAFNLFETELFLKTISPNIDRYQVLQLYMAIGGIPHYLKEVEGGKSAVQNIDALCFSKTGLLNDEFSLLYPALFDNSEEHIKIIRLLANKREGLTRKEIVKLGKLSEGGSTSKVIEELVHSGFVRPYYAFGKKKRDLQYRLTDEYTLFYLKFIEKNRSEGSGTWKKLSQTQAWKSWSGYAFESIGLKHIEQIKKALGIGGIYSEASTFSVKGNENYPGCQVDLLIDRNDHVINLVELKFYNQEYIMTKAYAQSLRIKAATFKAATKTRKQIFLILLSSFPLLPNQHSIGLIDQALTMNDLFEKV
jgi:AAA+ ATPase superfamily predicted ATPase